MGRVVGVPLEVKEVRGGWRGWRVEDSDGRVKAETPTRVVDENSRGGTTSDRGVVDRNFCDWVPVGLSRVGRGSTPVCRVCYIYS